MKILAQIILRKSQREGRLVRCLRDNACLLCTSAYAHTCYNKVMFTYDFTLKFDNGKLMASHQNNLSSYCVCDCLLSSDLLGFAFAAATVGGDGIAS